LSKSRNGCAEHAIALPGQIGGRNVESAEHICEHLHRLTKLAVPRIGLYVTASFGVAATPPLRTASELFAAADAAMYEAKRAGKNRVETAPDPVRQT